MRFRQLAATADHNQIRVIGVKVAHLPSLSSIGIYGWLPKALSSKQNIAYSSVTSDPFVFVTV